MLDGKNHLCEQTCSWVESLALLASSSYNTQCRSHSNDTNTQGTHNAAVTAVTHKTGHTMPQSQQ